MNMKILFKSLIFIVGLMIILHRIGMILTLKEYPVGANVNILISPYVLCDKLDGFYNSQNNVYDVVFIGSSNIHCNINPNVIWNEFGIPSYDFSCDQQELGTTYYYLQQVFETQSPKYIVIDTLLSGDSFSIDTTPAHFAFDHMKNDTIRVKAIWNRAMDNCLEIYFPLIAYHERWREIGINDITYAPSKCHNILNGAFIYMLKNPQLPVSIPTSISTDMPTSATERWLNLICEECKKNHCEVIFIKTPLAYYDKNLYSYFESVNNYCKTHNVTYLSMDLLFEGAQLDYSNDYADRMHLNWQGQYKLSKYLGEYLQGLQNIDDRRGDSRYSFFDDDYQEMMYYVDNFDELYNEVKK